MKPILSYLILSCKSATEKVEKNAFDNLSVTEKIQLQFHLSICKACQEYQKQSVAIDHFFKKNKKAFLAKEEDEKTTVLKTNIINQLNNL